jgi:hypothetical protein
MLTGTPGNRQSRGSDNNGTGPPGTEERRPGGGGARDGHGGNVTPTITPGTDAAGELRAWGAAVVHLHSLGLPAAVPPFPAAWLRRRGVKADWTAAA